MVNLIAFEKTCKFYKSIRENVRGVDTSVNIVLNTMMMVFKCIEFGKPSAAFVETINMHRANGC